jgi:hypothetical protein
MSNQTMDYGGANCKTSDGGAQPYPRLQQSNSPLGNNGVPY